MSDNKEHYDPLDEEYLPQGEEAPPPLVKVMGIVRWSILGGLSVFALIMILNYFNVMPMASTARTDVQYHCPMHPTYISDQPGDCPICGMSLVPIPRDGDTAQSDVSEMDAESSMSHDMGDMGKAPVPGLVPITIEPRRLQLIGTQTEVVGRQDLGGKVNMFGVISADETRIRNIHVRVNGWVLDLLVDQTGQIVDEGQPLMSVYSQELYQAEQDFLVARDALGQQSADSTIVTMRHQIFAASREKLGLLGLSDQEIEQLEASDLPSTQMMLRSPFSGYVLEKSVFPGQYLSPDQDLFKIVDLSVVWVMADVYEQDIRDIRVGQEARMKLDTYPGEVFTGEVNYIYPTVSGETRTAKVRIRFENPSMRFRPGMYAKIELVRYDKTVLAVSPEAVLDGGEIQYAFVVKNNTYFEPRLLKIGRASDDWIEILDGLSEGERVLTSANFLIDSESRLKAAVSGMGGTLDMPETQQNAPVGHKH